MRDFLTIERRRRLRASRRFADRREACARAASIALGAAWLAAAPLGVAEAQPAATESAGGLAGHEHAAHGSVSSATALVPADLDAAASDLGGGHRRHAMREDPLNSFVLLDRLEVRDADGPEIVDWELSAWVGRSLDRLWIRSEGRRQGGSTEHAELELLWGRGVARWWDLVAGLRRDFQPGPALSWAALGVQGLAPYRFEIEATAYLGEGGRTAARLEARHELLITNRLVLEPLVEIEAYGRSDPVRGTGTGLSRGEIGLRLRYEPRREVAPYLGVVREKKLGDTADLARAAGRDTSETRAVVGIRLWF